MTNNTNFQLKVSIGDLAEWISENVDWDEFAQRWLRDNKELPHNSNDGHEFCFVAVNPKLISSGDGHIIYKLDGFISDSWKDEEGPHDVPRMGKDKNIEIHLWRCEESITRIEINCKNDLMKSFLLDINTRLLDRYELIGINKQAPKIAFRERAYRPTAIRRVAYALYLMEREQLKPEEAAKLANTTTDTIEEYRILPETQELLLKFKNNPKEAVAYRQGLGNHPKS
jgi:hypothetical protein